MKRSEWTYQSSLALPIEWAKRQLSQISLPGSPLLDIMFSQTKLAMRDELYIDACPKAKTRTKIHLKGQGQQGEVC